MWPTKHVSRNDVRNRSTSSPSGTHTVHQLLSKATITIRSSWNFSSRGRLGRSFPDGTPTMMQLVVWKSCFEKLVNSAHVIGFPWLPAETSCSRADIESSESG